MAALATFAVGLSVLQALAPRQGLTDPGPVVLNFVLSLALTAATVRAVFGRRHRVFWLGFTVAGWLCVALALTYLQETRSYLLRHGPPLVRARDVHRNATVWARHRRVAPPPRPPEWYLLASLTAELGLGLALGTLAALAVGLFTVSVGHIARQASRLAQRQNLSGSALHQPRPTIPPERPVSSIGTANRRKAQTSTLLAVANYQTSQPEQHVKLHYPLGGLWCQIGYTLSDRRDELLKPRFFQGLRDSLTRRPYLAREQNGPLSEPKRTFTPVRCSK
jgi:hypothetical protein